MNARSIGTIPFEPDRLSPEIDGLLTLDLSTCAESMGSWKLGRNLWTGDGPSGGGEARGFLPAFPYLHRHIQETFRTELVTLARVFAATRGGYVLPHRDWHGSEPRFTRLHIPLQTDRQCLNSEDDAVYHMGAFEVWYLDGGRPHSGGCFSEIVRLHLVIDFTPGVALKELFRDSTRYQPSGSCTLIERPPFTESHLAAIYEFAKIATVRNLPHLVAAMGAVHFEKHVSCAAMYDWLIEIARRTGDPALVSESERLKSVNLEPSAPPEDAG